MGQWENPTTPRYIVPERLPAVCRCAPLDNRRHPPSDDLARRERFDYEVLSAPPGGNDGGNASSEGEESVVLPEDRDARVASTGSKALPRCLMETVYLGRGGLS
jgi:hypothetical protein